ncbi:MAG TPA: hypothetical protein VHF06_10860 [Pseudonocardiaceae bacterium]|jgi:seryl-tRNA synthetase|nr:hypothetical protein [Pseudonocardiaceae bacterium]
MFDSQLAEDVRPVATSAPGVYLFPESFETVVGRLRQRIAALAADEPVRRLAIPPVISRHTIERAGYVRTFPHLLGTVHSYTGDARRWGTLAPLVDEGGDWHADQAISDLVLLPAACYPVYRTLADESLAGPRKFAVEGTCFRQEATSEPGRLRSFRMVEIVTAATEEYCVEWRAHWLERSAGWLRSLGLDVSIDVADDPFFGPGKKLYQAAQRMQELKLELRVPLADGLVQAVASANFHKDHFGEAFAFTVDGSVGNTSCMAFGLERIALALVHAHGPDVLAVLGD